MMLSPLSILLSEPISAVQFECGNWNPIHSEEAQLNEDPIWLHLNYDVPATQQWLQHQEIIPDMVREPLAGESKRPRCSRIGDGFLITLRGIPNQEDGIYYDSIMNSLRIYITDSLIVTTNSGAIPLAQHFKNTQKGNELPNTTGEWLVELIDDITDHLTDMLDNIYERIITQENQLIECKSIDRSELAQIRKQLILLRRYLLPQRDVIHKVAIEKVSWLQDAERRQLQDLSDRVGRCVDDIDAAISRTAILAEEMSAILAEGMNQRTYTMSVLAAIFLPISFLTGLFGVNLAGIPGTQVKNGFGIFCLCLIAIGTVFGWWLKRNK